MQEPRVGFRLRRSKPSWVFSRNLCASLTLATQDKDEMPENEWRHRHGRCPVPLLPKLRHRVANGKQRVGEHAEDMGHVARDKIFDESICDGLLGHGVHVALKSK